MKLSITAVTRNRQFSKALIRLSTKLKLVKNIASDINTEEESFDILQFVFVDCHEEHCQVLGTEGKDRLCQIEVGIPKMENFKPETDIELFYKIINAIQKGIESSKMSEIISKIIIARINDIKNDS